MTFEKGYKMTQEHKDKIGNANRGKVLKGRYRNPNKSIYKSIRDSAVYAKWRSDVFERDSWTCQTCGVRGVKLEAHHIKLFTTIMNEYKPKTNKEAYEIDELWDIGNGVTLCRSCHNLTKKGRNHINGE